MSGKNPELDYAAPQDVTPVATRIRIERLKGSVRYTDPPGSRSVQYYQSFAVAFALALLTAAVFAPHWHLTGKSLVTAAIILVQVYVGKGALDIAQRYKTRPLIIEVSRVGLLINHPEYGCDYWERKQIDDIFEEPSFKAQFFSKMTIILDNGHRRRRMLHGRSAEEVNWLIGQLKTELGVTSSESP
jgi:hypothetical protein